jgi:hypothetical protein
MLWRVVVVLIGLGFVAHRVALWREIRKARRAGDTKREEHLRQHGFGLYRWAVLALLVFTVVLTALVWSNSR